MKAKKIRPATGTKTPEDLFHESGLSREEWNARLRQMADEASEAGADPAPYVLLMVDTDGKSVMTKLVEGVARQLAREKRGDGDDRD